MRIVSLLPAATEICCALGLGDDLVGVSPECDHPPAVVGKRIVSRGFLSYDGKSSGETSRMVGERLENGGALYQVDERALRLTEPEVILTQGLCEVCAPTLGDVEEVASRLPQPPSIVSLDPHCLEDVFADVERIGRFCDASDRARILVRSLRARIGRVSSRASKAGARPEAVCLEWLDPVFLAGHWVPEMVGLAGGHDALATPAEASRRVSPREIVDAAPEVAVLMPCGFGLDRTREEATLVTQAPWWRDLPAARTNRVWTVDGSSYFNRPGPRLVDGLEILAHILQPELFPSPPDPRDGRPWVG
ncbi:MAG: cobalamin-binding protein [Thermoplasmata archaeon]